MVGKQRISPFREKFLYLRYFIQLFYDPPFHDFSTSLLTCILKGIITCRYPSSWLWASFASGYSTLLRVCLHTVTSGNPEGDSTRFSFFQGHPLLDQIFSCIQYMDSCLSGMSARTTPQTSSFPGSFPWIRTCFGCLERYAANHSCLRELSYFSFHTISFFSFSTRSFILIYPPPFFC